MTYPCNSLLTGQTSLSLVKADYASGKHLLMMVLATRLEGRRLFRRTLL